MVSGAASEAPGAAHPGPPAVSSSLDQGRHDAHNVSTVHGTSCTVAVHVNRNGLSVGDELLTRSNFHVLEGALDGPRSRCI